MAGARLDHPAGMVDCASVSFHQGLNLKIQMPVADELHTVVCAVSRRKSKDGVQTMDAWTVLYLKVEPSLRWHPRHGRESKTRTIIVGHCKVLPCGPDRGGRLPPYLQDCKRPDAGARNWCILYSSFSNLSRVSRDSLWTMDFLWTMEQLLLYVGRPLLRDERKCLAAFGGATGAAYAVYIIVKGIWKVVVNDVRYVLNVNAARRDIGCH